MADPQVPDDFDGAPCVEPGPPSFDVLADPNERAASWYPGAYVIAQGGNGGSITARPAENVFHIAASNWNIDPNDPMNGGRGIAGWNNSARACNGYIDQYGNMQQYASVWSSVNGTKDGNWRCRTWESWNPEGLSGSTFDTSTWTGEQCERFSDLLAWDSIENGTILQDMNDSRRGSHGNGVHRYGITGYNPWRAVGGEVWSGSSGKVCPGSARVRQLPGIVMRARVIADAVRAGRCGYLRPGRVDLNAALGRTGNQPTEEWDEMATKEEITALFDARLKAVMPSVINDAVANVLRAPEFRLSLANIVKDRREDVFRATADVLHAPEFAGWQEETRRAAAVILKDEPEPVQKTYTVVAGDTLAGIARKFGVTVEDLVAWNGISDPNNISVGQVLKVSAPKA